MIPILCASLASCLKEQTKKALDGGVIGGDGDRWIGYRVAKNKQAAFSARERGEKGGPPGGGVLFLFSLYFSFFKKDRWSLVMRWRAGLANEQERDSCG